MRECFAVTSCFHLTIKDQAEVGRRKVRQRRRNQKVGDEEEVQDEAKTVGYMGGAWGRGGGRLRIWTGAARRLPMEGQL